MAKILPFLGIRPQNGVAQKIAALPYDVYNKEEARQEVLRHPDSFLKIDRAETLFPEDTDMYSQEVYVMAAKTLWQEIEDGTFIQDETPCFYIYEQTMNGRKQTGIVATAWVDDYLNNVIKKHENTREEKELDRICHVDTCNAQTGPIFLTYRRDAQLTSIMENVKKNAPVYDFVSEDGIGHKVWIISDKVVCDKITELFGHIQQIYIADGHHRCASAVKVSLKRRKENPDYTGEEAFNYFLSVLFPGDELYIMDYNRVVTDLNGLTPDQFLQRIGSAFSFERISTAAIKPEKKGQISMFLADKWYLLNLSKCEKTGNPVEDLDVSILQRMILNPILNIKDPKKDKRIDFVGGIRGLEELEKRVHSDCKVAFAIFPTGIEELFSVSDAGMLMPPKSTWFEPKLRSGLFIHSIK